MGFGTCESKVVELQTEVVEDAGENIKSWASFCQLHHAVGS